MTKISKSKKGRRSPLFSNLVNPSAFSLIEIVLALGIISFALVGIMGLFPVAMRAAQESQRETRAAQIATQIFSDLKSLPASNTAIATNTNILSSQIRINLATPSSNAVSYTQEGLPIGQGTTADAIYRADIVVTTNVTVNGLSRVQATVETPARAASSNRSKYIFITLMDGN